MAHRPVWLVAAVVLLGGLLGSCAARGAGPQAWIDTPLDNTVLPLGPVTIIAHASAEGGVAAMEFTIDDQPYRSVAADGGRLVWREVEWNPPGFGTYRIGVRGIGADGAAGSLVSSLVTISGNQALPVPIPQPEALPVPLPQPESLPVPPSVIAKMDANCREGPGTAYDTYGSLLQGQKAEITGRLADNSWWLVLLAGRSTNCWIAASVVDVEGDLNDVQIVAASELPAGGEPPSADVIESPPIAVDSAPPSFDNIDAALADCPSRIVTVAAAVGDDIGLSSVTANWSMDGDGSGQVQLSLGYLAYWATIDPGDAEGTMRVRILATDTSGNTATSDWLLVGVQACID